MIALKKWLSVLIIDDLASNRATLRQSLVPLLSDEDCVEEASNGMVALQLIQARLASNQPYGLIVLDFCMPELNGQQVTYAIRNLEKKFHFPRQAIITWSSSAKRRYEGADGLLSKPIKQSELAVLIQSLVAARDH